MGKYRSKLLFVLTNLISVICLIWVLHDANLPRLRTEVAHLDWLWVLVAALADVTVYCIQGWRWAILLRPIAAVSVLDAIRAIYVGLFANEVLPLRAGEVIRCYLYARWSEIPVSVSLASALIERIFDGLWLVSCLWAAVHLVRLPGYVRDGGTFLAVLVLVCGALLAIAMYWKQQTLDILVRANRARWMHVLIEDLHQIGHSRYLYIAFLVSLPYLLFQVIPIFAIIRAYRHLDEIGFQAAFVLIVMLRLGAVIPQAPGNVGTFQALTVVGLRLFGVQSQIAKRFSLILWCVITLPLLIVGFVALAFTGIRMGELHSQAKKGMERRGEVPEPTTGVFED